MNTSEFIHSSAEKNPNQLAIIEGNKRISYYQLSTSINAMATELKQLGLGKNQGIAVLGSNSTDFVILAFAVMQLEAVVLPLPHHLSESELNDFVAVSNLHCICFNKNYKKYPAPKIESNQLTLSWTIWKNPHNNISKSYITHVNNPALLRFTSGTTGKSKGVILSHKAIFDRTAVANSVLNLNESDKILWVLSMAFHFVVSIMLYLRYGCTIIIANKFLAKDIINDINQFKATLLYASPMHIRLLSQDTTSIQINSIRSVISTSTGISKEQCVKFFKRFNKPVTQAFGIIEIGLPVINYNNSENQPDAIGYALPGFIIKVLDDDNQELPLRSVGNLAIKGPGMFDAYLSPPLTIEKILQNGFFMTGDLATISPDGLIYVVGRKKSMINVAGNKVFPEEVEGVLMQLDSINKCKVSGYSHVTLGEAVKAEIELHPKATKPDTEFLYTYCQQQLSSYKIPQKFEFVDQLTLTKSGKIKR